MKLGWRETVQVAIGAICARANRKPLNMPHCDVVWERNIRVPDLGLVDLSKPAHQDV